MPIYEYQCQACGHELEALQKISDPLLTDCPHCHAASLKKKVSAAAFRLKGGGWYETDFKSGNKKNVVGESGGAAASDTKSTGSDTAGTAKSSGGETSTAKTSTDSSASKAAPSGGSAASN